MSLPGLQTCVPTAKEGLWGHAFRQNHGRIHGQVSGQFRRTSVPAPVRMPFVQERPIPGSAGARGSRQGIPVLQIRADFSAPAALLCQKGDRQCRHGSSCRGRQVPERWSWPGANECPARICLVSSARSRHDTQAAPVSLCASVLSRAAWPFLQRNKVPCPARTQSGLTGPASGCVHIPVCLPEASGFFGKDRFFREGSVVCA